MPLRRAYVFGPAADLVAGSRLHPRVETGHPEMESCASAISPWLEDPWPKPPYAGSHGGSGDGRVAAEMTLR
jgi:hypothetical protein